VWLSIPFLIVVLFACWWKVSKLRFEHARAEWMKAALPQLAKLSIANREIGVEFDNLNNGGNPGLNRDWTGENVLMMTNGEYLIYAFRHGFNNGFVDHLFLAHSSDGRWWYSTYHFCGHMVGVQNDDAPGSIAEFSRKYSAREFDGKSEECLKHTWPP
jgi:hypothetical protein